MLEVPLDFPRAWVEFINPDDPTELIKADLTWLTSAYTCIFGSGCAGIYESSPSVGCCTLGAHFSDEADEVRTQGWVDNLTAEQWEFKPAGRPTQTDDWVDVDDEGARKTKVHVIDGESGCVFANRPGFVGGAGCALHLAAMDAGVSHVETKPDVCWQLPIRRMFHEVERTDGSSYTEVTITEYDRRGWGEGGHDLDWYCTGNPVAHVGVDPLFVTSKDELTAMLGPQGYAELSRHCEHHVRSRSLLAIHPAYPR